VIVFILAVDKMMLFDWALHVLCMIVRNWFYLVVAEDKWRECGGNDMGSIATDAL
jgi:hypothetical protein